MSKLLGKMQNLAPVADIVPFSKLNNLKIISQAAGNDHWIIEKHFATKLLADLISSVYFDESWYRSKYPDINASIDRGIIKSAKDHYCQFGYFEHRMPYRIEVMEDWYLAQYPDVRAGIRRDDFATGQEHFELEGYREGRVPYPNFNLRRG